MKQSVSEVYGPLDLWETPELYLQTIGEYAGEIARGRAALEVTKADLITFYWVGKPDRDGFIMPIENDPDENIPEACMYEYYEKQPKIPMGIVSDDHYDVTWQGPDLKVSRMGATLVWTGKHTDAKEIWVDVNEAII